MYLSALRNHVRICSLSESNAYQCNVNRGVFGAAKVSHFRQLSRPFEVIEFESERGKGMGVVVGVMWAV